MISLWDICKRKGKDFVVKRWLIYPGFLFAAYASAAQSFVSAKIELIWSDSLRKYAFSDFRLREVIHFKGCSYEEQQFGYLPCYVGRQPLAMTGQLRITLTDTEFEPLPFKHQLLAQRSPHLGTSVQVIGGIGFERNKPVAGFTIFPFRRNEQGTVERLKSFRYVIEVIPTAPPAVTRDGETTQSVLSSGIWFKLGVTRDGIHRIDAAFLQSMGIDVNNLDPRTLRIFGNGGSMVPEANKDFRYDDLQENAIYVFGEADGRFDAGDYLLFYGQGPDRWKLDTVTNRFYHLRHAYADTIAYFLTFGGIAGKRIALQPNTQLPPTRVFTTFHDYAVHEKDLENFLASGRTFYGEAFEFNPQQVFSFPFPNLVAASPVKVVATFMAKSIYANSSVEIRHDQQLIATATIPKICAEYTCPFGAEAKLEGQFFASSSPVNVEVRLIKNAVDTRGWLNYIEVNAERTLAWTGNQMAFRHIQSRTAGTIDQYVVSNANSSLSVWNITHPLSPQLVQYDLEDGSLTFALPSDGLREFIVFASGQGYEPAFLGQVANQNLHAMQPAELILVTADRFATVAEEYADVHRSRGLSVIVASVSQIYNEFSSGTPDAGAIRDFVRMFYVRAGGDSLLMPRFLLLLGDGSYDNKGIDPAKKSLIPTFQSINSISPVSSYVTDDFFGFLDDNEGGNMVDPYAYLDIAIGRIPVNTEQEARAVLNKIKIYTSTRSFGNWRNWITFVADDEDNNVHITDADNLAKSAAGLHPYYNIDKIYLDAYKQISVPGGKRYPDVNTAIMNRLAAGTLMINYIGHGGESGWAHERVLTIPEMESLTNVERLPLFITATCEFTRYDDPSIVSAGELLAIKEDGGAIALVTTCRLVYSSANAEMNEAFMYWILAPDAQGQMPYLGEAMRKSKNATSGQGANNRKFTLIGDPSLRLAYPTYQIKTTSVNGQPVGSFSDTIRALQKVTIAGEIIDHNQQRLSDFSGVLYATVFDKAVTYQTLKNDPASYIKNFTLQKNVIYNGKASVHNGEFSFSFVVPKDISYVFGPGKVSYYAASTQQDAHGYQNDLLVGGIDYSAPADAEGPQVRVYMNDTKFVTGGLTDPNPIVLVRISDSSGINTVGTGIGHDIVGVLDHDTQGSFVMNDYYSADLDTYTSGEVRYPLYNLSEGPHHIKVKAWDVYNNSAEGAIDFVVAASSELALAHVFNYPNPFTTHTEFMFEHNKAHQSLDVLIQIFTVSGRLVKTLRAQVVPAASHLAGTSHLVGGGYRVEGISWDGRDEWGQPLGKGVYIYRLTVRTAQGQQAHHFEKLVLLK